MKITGLITIINFYCITLLAQKTDSETMINNLISSTTIKQSKETKISVNLISLEEKTSDFDIHNALEGEFPYHVSLFGRNNDNTYGHFCSGAIISPHHIITAAHCTDGEIAADIVVMFGRLEATYQQPYTRQVIQIIVHVLFNLEGHRSNDISILVLGNKLIYSNTIQSIKLTNHIPEVGKNCLLSGWESNEFQEQYKKSDFGTLYLNNLKVVKLNITNKCSDDKIFNDKQMLCTYAPGKNACFGDSGGPLICNGKLAGIVSWGNDNQCSNFSVYTNVYYYRDWINNMIKLPVIKKDSDNSSKSCWEKCHSVFFIILIHFIYF